MKTLICFPFAGAGASAFRAWLPRLQPHLNVVAVQLPGREQRFVEEPFTSIERAIDSLLPSLTPVISDSEEVTMFGHSMGAMLAFELARRIADISDLGECRLVVSGSPSPICPRDIEATGLNDEEFIAQVERFAGYSHEALADPEMRELLLPLLRADVLMHERYRPDGLAPLSMPIHCVRAADDTLVTRGEARAWQSVTVPQLEYTEVRGGHMYLVDDPSEIITLLTRPNSSVL